jgi:aspartyl-tRNA(Asn)/glutamyl-tRNA(Gln) amidotransferase subunit C
MALTRDEVLKVGRLGRIHLSDDEVERIASQLSSILEYVDKLRELDTRGVEPQTHALPLKNVLRPDEPRPGLTAEQALANAPQSDGDFFRVPRVLDEEAGA